MWPDVWIKITPIFSSSCLSSVHCGFYLKSDVFKKAQKSRKYLGYFCHEICDQELKKLPNLFNLFSSLYHPVHCIPSILSLSHLMMFFKWSIPKRAFESISSDYNEIQRYIEILESYPHWSFAGQNMSLSRHLFLNFCPLIQLTVNVLYEHLPMTGFEPRTSYVISDWSGNWTTTTCRTFFVKIGHSRPLFLYFRLFYKQVNRKNWFNEICRWLDSNRGPMVSVVTALAIEPQPLAGHF